MTMTEDITITIEQLQKRLRDAHARIGFEGRFAFSIDQSAGLRTGSSGACYVTHWFRPTPYAFEDCKAVCSGSVADCIAALDRYVASYPKTGTVEDLARTLGLPERPVDRRAVLHGYGDREAQAAEFREKAGDNGEPPFREGWEAFVNKIEFDDCPYTANTDACHAWREGWLGAERHIKQ